MGRRVEMRTMKDDTETLQRFVYDNYLCVQQLRGADNTLAQFYVWDPTEPIATRPLVFLPTSGEVAYYFHDGNKNVSDLVDIQGNIVHYAYTPFGTPTASSASDNPFRFSSEFYDKRLDLVYYNYRHYISKLGRWCVRDSLDEKEGVNLFSTQNNPTTQTDYLGQSVVTTTITAAAVALFVNKCIKPAYYEGSLTYGERTDKFRHCWTSCTISRRCGGQMAQFAGLGKEAWDSAVRLAIQMGWTEDGGRGTGDWADSFYDWVANNTCIGIESYFGLPAAWIGGAVRESCECCCEREYK